MQSSNTSLKSEKQGDLFEVGANLPRVEKMENSAEGRGRSLTMSDLEGIQKKYGPKVKGVAERFWKKVKKGGPDDCWEWIGRSSHYGLLRISGQIRRQIHAHRVSYVLNKGPIPAGLWVLHHCDNKRCVRPDHLFLGTPADNSQDAVSKNRMPSGEQKSHLRQAEVDAIRHRYAMGGITQRELAAEYGVGQVTVCRIIQKTRWIK